MLLKIEQCRKEMIALAEKHGMSSDKVIRASRHLDEMLNEYQRLKETSTESSPIKNAKNR